MIRRDCLLNVLRFGCAVSSMSSSDCGPSRADSCYDKVAATHLKAAAIAVILCTSALGVSIPSLCRRIKFLRVDGNPFFIGKAFAAGVILATGFVHMLPDAQSTLGSPCLPSKPWAKFPWAGFIAMTAALCTLVMDFAATEFYLHRHGLKHGAEKAGDSDDKTGDIENDNAGHVHPHSHVGHVHPHSHEHEDDDDSAFSNVRRIVVAQVLEFGIVAHSVIIGITLGVSSSPCVIKPLFAALTFHQFFEGFALGGCIAQAGFRTLNTLVMGFFFAITTPLGIGIGMGIATTYNENSPKALIVEGVFDSTSAGILVYMALVDLIAADFLSKRMRSSRQLQVGAFLALFLGSGCMALLGVWA
jgi:zinc transporter 1/2/3